MKTRRQLLSAGAIGAGAVSLHAAGLGAVGTATTMAAGVAPMAAVPQRRRTLRIAHITDLHVQPEKNAPKGMQTCLEQAQGESPDVIFMGGDLVMDSLEVDRSRLKTQWDVYDDVLKANVRLPVETVLGNHDVWGWDAREKYSADPLFGKRFALDRLRLDRPYRSFDRAGWHFVLLDSTHAIDGNGYTARLDDEQFAWLADDLGKVPQRIPVLVLSHIPILGCSVFFDGENEKSGDWRVPGSWMHIDARRIKDLFYRHKNVKVALSGHEHLVDRVDYLGTSYFCNGACCGKWWDGPYHEFPNGYAIVDLFDDGTAENRYVPYAWTPAP